MLREWLASKQFYKGRSQEKTHLLRPEFFLLLSPLDRARSVLTYRAMCSVAGPCGPVNWVLSISGFHRFLATKPSVPKPTKQNGGQFGDHSSIWDSWPWGSAMPAGSNRITAERIYTLFPSVVTTGDPLEHSGRALKSVEKRVRNKPAFKTIRLRRLQPRYCCVYVH
jgi:hypothetical protein